MFDDTPFYKKRKFKQISLISILVIILLIFYLSFQLLAFHLISVNPNINNINTVAPNLVFNFNQKLSKNIKVSSDPNFILSYGVKNDQLIINLNTPLQTSTTYSLKISGIESISGSKIGDLNYSFKPIFNPNGLTKSQKQTLLQNQADYNKHVYSNSILQLLPFTGPNFEYQIGYTTSKNGQIILQITALGSQNQQAALNFLKSLSGFNQNNYQIQYINAQP